MHQSDAARRSDAGRHGGSDLGSAIRMVDVFLEVAEAPNNLDWAGADAVGSQNLGPAAKPAE